MKIEAGNAADVKIPMMPKGVEHRINSELALEIGLVKIPMMPKGVEHYGVSPVPTMGFCSCEDSNDAERR